MIKKYILLVLFIAISAYIGFTTSIPAMSTENEFQSGSPTKTLYIVRHAKSDHTNSNLVDFDRPLEKKGEENAKTVGELLKRKKVELDLIISSPSKRTYETARIICGEIDFNIQNVTWDSTIYGCTLQQYVDVLKSVNDDHDCIMVIGHNPATTHVANLLQNEKAISEVPTAGIVAIEFKISSWKEIGKKPGKLLFFYDPDDITKNSD